MICIVCSKLFEPPAACPDCGWAPASITTPDSPSCGVGDVLSARYAILENKGAGRFGTSFVARDYKFNSKVNLLFIHKMLLPETTHRKRFVEGMRFLLQNNYAMSARVLDVGLLEGRAYVTTEYFDGVPLKDLLAKRALEQRPFALAEAFGVVRQLAAFLVESDAGCHGLLSPGTIYVLPGKLKVSRLGLLENLPPAAAGYALTASPRYQRFVAPEVLAGEGVGTRGDVYSLAVCLVEMLTQKRFEGDLGQVLSLHDKALTEVLLCALAKNKGERYRDAEVFVHAICDATSLPTPVFSRPWKEVPEDSVAMDESALQAERTARIVMKDVIAQHYEEITRVGQNPLLEKERSLKRQADKATVPSPFRAMAPAVQPVDDVRAGSNEGSQEVDLEELEISVVRSVKEITRNIHIKEISVQPVSVGAHQNEHKPVTERLAGVDPRLLRAAAADMPAGKVHTTETTECDDDDWRRRIGREVTGEDKVVSFLAPTSSSHVHGFASRPGLFSDSRMPPAPPRPPKPHKPPKPRKS